MDEGGNEALTGAQKADMLNKFFSKCFNRRSAPLEAWSESDFNLISLITLQTRFFAMKIQYVSFWQVWMSPNLVAQTGFRLRWSNILQQALPLLSHSSSTCPSVVAEYLGTGNYHQLYLFPNREGLIPLTTTDQYPCLAFWVKCWRNISMP